MIVRHDYDDDDVLFVKAFSRHCDIYIYIYI